MLTANLTSAQMEDRAVCAERVIGRMRSAAGFYATYDGHNGASAAQCLSERLHEKVFAALAALPRWVNNKATSNCCVICILNQRHALHTNLIELMHTDQSG